VTEPELPVPDDDEVQAEFDGELPVEADEADAVEQLRDVPDAGEDDYPG
jgi:hypothetical protein